MKIHAWAFDAHGQLWGVAKEQVFSELSIVRMCDRGILDMEPLAGTMTVDSPGIVAFDDSVFVFGDFGSASLQPPPEPAGRIVSER